MSWDDLKPLLLEQTTLDPSPLLAYPDPRVGGDRRAPYRIRLAAWASDLAGQLHGRFGDEVALVVGCLAYPGGERVDARGRPLGEATMPDAPLVDQAALDLDLPGELVVATGHDAEAEIRVTNHTRDAVELRLPWESWVVDPADGTVVGGLPPRQFVAPGLVRLAPRATTSVPIRVGTASWSLDLGWAVPPGDWAARVYLDRGGRLERAPLLPLTVTA